MRFAPSSGNTLFASPNLDQAEGLRRIFAKHRAVILPVLAPGGQQGGLVANLAMALTLSGREVLIVDTARGEVPQAMGLRARYELADVVSGDKRLQEVVLSPLNGLRIVPAARALAQASDISQWVSALVSELTPHPDVVIVHLHTPLAGMEGDVLIAASPIAETVTRTYAALKRMQTKSSRIRLVVCGTAAEQGARNLHRALNDATQRFIGAAIEWAGFIPQDEEMSRAHASARPVFDLDTQAPSALALMNLAARVDSWSLASVSPSRIVY
ncbi:MAG TPA: hypothetical protein VJU83_08615 [Burkholderiales bacterium]|nr:hypothetical protein [Burkholderiales bacterium]